MAYKFFTVPLQNAGEAEAELNAFLAIHKVLAGWSGVHWRTDRGWIWRLSFMYIL